MIIDFAQKTKGRQFILISPQDMTFFPAHEIQISELSDFVVLIIFFFFCLFFLSLLFLRRNSEHLQDAVVIKLKAPRGI